MPVCNEYTYSAEGPNLMEQENVSPLMCIGICSQPMWLPHQRLSLGCDILVMSGHCKNRLIVVKWCFSLVKLLLLSYSSHFT